MQPTVFIFAGKRSTSAVIFAREGLQPSRMVKDRTFGMRGHK